LTTAVSIRCRRVPEILTDGDRVRGLRWAVSAIGRPDGDASATLSGSDVSPGANVPGVFDHPANV
jgi:hypothetical protein